MVPSAAKVDIHKLFCCTSLKPHNSRKSVNKSCTGLLPIQSVPLSISFHHTRNLGRTAVIQMQVKLKRKYSRSTKTILIKYGPPSCIHSLDNQVVKNHLLFCSFHYVLFYTVFRHQSINAHLSSNR
jgi:hypothetical protein